MRVRIHVPPVRRLLAMHGIDYHAVEKDILDGMTGVTATDRGLYPHLALVQLENPTGTVRGAFPSVPLKEPIVLRLGWAVLEEIDETHGP